MQKKKIARNEDSLRDLWENIKCNSILIISVPEVVPIGYWGRVKGNY